ncbi:acyl-CoA dehydrogenase family protein [Bradyrhizobium sp. Ash2021]|uniref:acyl-CoA dehydrogenase family protein n=1 Tax=Bradyrhizobium sp. Ash2021 TaxID=2954771 RepID=UPI002815C655|nr:acyl-CoA dehydrogenase family protein [Bradyrhizobium sp. Ash2021]WMT74290.1 acyl-CoA dehydrogenase family protein [Bradyrhizobium sp. Ash2021]
MQPLKHDRKVASAGQPDLLAPDTSGMNFYQADPALTDLLRLHLPEALFRHIEPHLDRLGGLAGGHLDECARLADRHTPVLHQRDRFGRDSQYIEYHPAYRELEKAAFGEFGIHAMSVRKGILGWPDKYPVVAKHAFTFLFNQAEFGLGCPINVTDGCAKLLNNFGSEALKAKYLDGLTQTDMSKLTQGGQFMTEKEGGSDVGTLTTTAVQEGDHWRLTGEKWFCSNADAEVVMLLARPEGAGPGTRGVGLFLMPRRLEDGSQNHYRIVRLKDKLGTRSMASGEIKLEGAIAYAVGKLDRGFVQMAEMVNSSRLSNGVKSTALMRRAYHDAMTVAKGRVVFGQRIFDLPLARRQLMKIGLATEQALSMSFLTADALDRAEAGSQDAAALLRILTPTLKFRATRDARKVCGDALEMRGGIGYIEEFATARLLRDAHLGSIWEGTGNIVAIDALKRAVGRHGADAALAADLHARLDDSANVPQAWRNRLRDLADRAIGFARDVASRMENEADARRATSLLYHVASAVALAWEGGRIHEMRGDARRLLLSRMVIDHRVVASDPFRLTENAVQRAITDHLLGERGVGMAEVGELISAA